MKVSPDKQTARLSIEKRRRGKMVTVIAGLSSEETDLPALLKQLKNHCGAGGTLADSTLEIQGKQLDRVREKLKSIGYKIKG
ncbi:MAG: translation initiation factor [Fuerstiella sp.]